MDPRFVIVVSTVVRHELDGWDGMTMPYADEVVGEIIVGDKDALATVYELDT